MPSTLLRALALFGLASQRCGWPSARAVAWQAVAGAALSAAALLNLPPWFLEFLLCLPWARLGELYRCAACAAPSCR